MSLFSRKRGFTLIELLLVIGIIAILAAIVIVAINPTKQLGDARNAARKSDVNTIINAIYQYAIDNNGNLPAGIDTTVREICKHTTALSDCEGTALQLSGSLVPTYVGGIPADPKVTASGTGTRYTVVKTNTTPPRVTIAAPDAENATISITR